MAEEIVEAAREGNSDPVEAGVKAHQQAEVVEEEVKPLSAAEREQRRLQAFFDLVLQDNEDPNRSTKKPPNKLI